jgi:hypothetical protein
VPSVFREPGNCERDNSADHFFRMSFHVHDIVSSESIPDLRTRVREAVQTHLRKLGRESPALRPSSSLPNDSRLTRGEKLKARVSNLMIGESSHSGQVGQSKAPRIRADREEQVCIADVSSSDRFLLLKIARTKALILSETRRLDSIKLRLLQAQKQRYKNTEPGTSSKIEGRFDTNPPDVSAPLESLREEPSEVSCYRRLHSKAIIKNDPEEDFGSIKQDPPTSGSGMSSSSVAAPFKTNSDFRRDFRTESFRSRRKTSAIHLKDKADYMKMLNRTISHKLH